MRIAEVEIEMKDSGVQEQVEMRDVVYPTLRMVNRGRGRESRIKGGRG